MSTSSSSVSANSSSMSQQMMRKRAHESNVSTTGQQTQLKFTSSDTKSVSSAANHSQKRDVIELSDDEEDEEDEKKEEMKEEKKLTAAILSTSNEQATKKRKLTIARSIVTSSSSSSSAITFLSSPYWSYHSRAVSSPAACQRYYDTLRSLVDPIPGKLFIYGKECTEKRLTKMYARVSGTMKYSGTEKIATGEWPECIEELYQVACQEAYLQRQRVPEELRKKEEEVRRQSETLSSTVAAASSSSSSSSSTPTTTTTTPPVYWDTVLINYYRSGDDSISWHSDKDSHIFPIASFSFGAEREFHIRARPAVGEGKTTKTSSLKKYAATLENGSLLMMWPGMQERYHHSVPPRKGIQNGRVNVTFRLHHRMEADAPVVAKV